MTNLLTSIMQTTAMVNHLVQIPNALALRQSAAVAVPSGSSCPPPEGFAFLTQQAASAQRR